MPLEPLSCHLGILGEVKRAVLPQNSLPSCGKLGDSLECVVKLKKVENKDFLDVTLACDSCNLKSSLQKHSSKVSTPIL